MAIEKNSSLGLKARSEARRLKKKATDSERENSGKVESNLLEAEQKDREAEVYLVPRRPFEIGAGNESLPLKTSGIENYHALKIKETLQDPNQVSLDASQSRMELASDAKCLDMAVDAADSIEANNSLEKMLVHQLAACHDMAMTLISQAHIEREPTDIQKVVNSSARLMSVFQHGLQTLQKLRTGGRQEVVVQHVKIEGGGKAVVTGRMDKGG